MISNRPSKKVSFGAIMWALLLSSLFFVPYCTGAIAYMFERQILPIRPVYYMIGSGLIVMASLWRAKPVIVSSYIALLSLQVLRFLDALVLNRIPSSEGLSMLMVSGASLFYVLCIGSMSGRGRTIWWCAMICAVSGIAICAWLNFQEWSTGFNLTTVEGRASGWIHNANDSAVAITMMTALFLALEPPLILVLVMLLISWLGVYFTLSRGGAIVWLSLVAGYLMLSKGTTTKIALRVAIVLIAGSLLMSRFINSIANVATDQRDVQSREEFFQGKAFNFENDSGRIELLAEAASGVLERPILGYGTGASQGALFSPHNIVIGLWVDNGFSAPVLFALSIWLLVRDSIRHNKAGLIIVLAMVAWAPFSQNIADDKSYLLAWALGCFLSAQASRPERDASIQVRRSSRFGAQWSPNPQLRTEEETISRRY